MTETQAHTLIEFAKTFVGIPYSYGAATEEAPHAFDCSSFTQYVFHHVGIELPRSSILQAAAESGKEIDVSQSLSSLLPGDLVFMRGVRGFYRDSLFGGREISIGHVGIYIGNNMVIHAQAHDEPYGVVIQSVAEMTKDSHYAITFTKRF